MLYMIYRFARLLCTVLSHNRYFSPRASRCISLKVVIVVVLVVLVLVLVLVLVTHYKFVHISTKMERWRIL